MSVQLVAFLYTTCIGIGIRKISLGNFRTAREIDRVGSICTGLEKLIQVIGAVVDGSTPAVPCIGRCRAVTILKFRFVGNFIES
ncbi:hypothetical protein D3C85_979610 [compost metagenome]